MGYKRFNNHGFHGDSIRRKKELRKIENNGKTFASDAKKELVSIEVDSVPRWMRKELIKIKKIILSGRGSTFNQDLWIQDFKLRLDLAREMYSYAFQAKICK